MLIKNGLVFSESGGFEPLSILTQEGRITGLLPAEAMIKYAGEVIDASGCYVLPGLVDVHFHGCKGHDFCEGSAEAFQAISEYEFSRGVTAICPATMTLPEKELKDILEHAAEYYREQDAGDAQTQGAELLGIHLEGPFLNPEKRGAQRLEDIQKPSAKMLAELQMAADGLIRIVTIAPEEEGAIDCIKAILAHDEGIHFSIGHTQSDYDTAQKAFAAGADHITHLYNAMPPFSHRAPGVVGAAFDEQDCFVELICDGIHVAPSVVRATFQMFGEDRVILISDSMEATGMPDGSYQLGGQHVNVKGKRATLEDGTLAGSVTDLYDCLKNAISMGIPIECAIKAATINPCRSIGMEGDYGSIAIGKKAKLLLIDKENLSIRKVLG